MRPTVVAVVAVVAVGGAAGACLRAVLTTTYPSEAEAFPWTTFVINVAGSFLLAMLPAASLVRRRPLLGAALGPGLLGGFTTFSAYSDQTRLLLASGRTGVAGAYLLGTLAACLLAVAVASRLVHNRPPDEPGNAG